MGRKYRRGSKVLIDHSSHFGQIGKVVGSYTTSDGRRRYDVLTTNPCTGSECLTTVNEHNLSKPKSRERDISYREKADIITKNRLRHSIRDRMDRELLKEFPDMDTDVRNKLSYVLYRSVIGEMD